MKRGPIIHAVLLVLVLGFAYQTWTREKKVEPKTGKVEVWSKPADSLEAVLFETKDRTLRVERRKDDAGGFLWGKETRVSRHKKRPPKPPAAGQDAGVPATDKDAGVPPEPEEEIKTSTREFPGGEAADELFANFAKLRALRDLGELDDAERAEYGLAESTDNITAIFADGQRSLILGGRIYGSSDRYVVDTTTNHGYAIAGAVVRGLTSGETALRVKELHRFEPDKVATAALATAAGGKRTLVRTTVKGPKGDTKGWADPATPDKHDQTMANFLDSILKLRPSAYLLDLKAETLTPVVTIDYRDGAGKPLGRFELYKDSGGEGDDDLADRSHLPHRGQDVRVEVFRHGSAVAARDDLHGLQMVERGLVGPLAAQGVVDIADTQEARRQGNGLTPLAVRIPPAVPPFVVMERDLGTRLEMG